jgi:hypothetical protein
MFALLLANSRLIGIGAAVIAILSGVLWLRSHWIGVGEARVEASYQAAWNEAQAEAAKVRAKDQERAKDLSATLTALSTVYADLRAQPPVILTQTKLVPANAPTCPVSSLSSDFRLRYNQAALNP